MLNKVKNIVNLVRNMGWRYISYRSKHEVLRRTGTLKNSFPARPAQQTYMTLAQWKEQGGTFFFAGREALTIPKVQDPLLAARYKDYRQGNMLFFNSLQFSIPNYDWITNPDNGYKYDIAKHWTEIQDLSAEAGDIKYVWEKSRFSFLYDIIRYDYHFDTDCAENVFGEILSWIKGNPVNYGPNYRCSQEISLRVLNWTFALYYYKNSPHLTEAIFADIQYAIYWQVHHVYHNIDFSRIAVRNNHAITETLTLYLAGIIYPFVADFKKWGAKGKKWFEEEIAYQVYQDGTFLQFSMNYHRVVVQLLTWGITLARKNNDKFAPVVYQRAAGSVKFLCTCMVPENGNLPNYGANDGALFFRLTTSDYRDYRPQLQALSKCLGIHGNFAAEYEDALWYGIDTDHKEQWQPALGPSEFTTGGYYIIREEDTLTFIRCGNHKDRPSQADNLHLDVWYKGENILLDAGSYKYNTDEETLRYFVGTASHNTVMVGNKDQMLKGKRFIWYNWSQRVNATLSEDAQGCTFKGTIKAFYHLNTNIRHTRTVIKVKGQPEWKVVDELQHLPAGESIHQLWHLPAHTLASVSLAAEDSAGNKLEATGGDGWTSSYYGRRSPTRQITFSTKEPTITTFIKYI